MIPFRSRPLSSNPSYARNRRALIILGVLGFLAVCGKMLYLTVIQSEQYQERAQRNLLSHFRLDSPRGNFLDRNGNVLATNRRSYSVTFSPWGQNNEDATRVLEAVADVLPDITSEQIEEILSTRPRWTRHTLARRVAQADLLPIIERPGAFPGVRLSTDHTREYRFPTDFAHLIGYLGRIQPDEVETYTRPRYLLDDEVGRAGLERALQDRLAGYPGRERQRRDARQRLLDEPEIIEAARPGENVWLTLDLHLQRKAMELLGEKMGSIVVLDVQTGELVVLASRPTFDATNLSRHVDGREPGFFHRAARGRFPPGSPFKIVGAALALSEGISHTHTIHCGGGFQPAGWNRTFHCNVRTGHGPLNLADSIKYSCNVYYYQISQDIGPDRWLEMAGKLGFGRTTGSDIPGESPGSLPELTSSMAGERVNFSIGQGSLLATPLQVANMFAALANGGYLTIPHVVRHIGHESPTTTTPRLQSDRIPLTREQIQQINSGLHKVVNEPGGTAWRAQIPADWGVVGKTGTVENAKGGTDAWFTGFFPYGAPRYAFVVQLEEIDLHGGEAAALLARELIREMLFPGGDGEEVVEAGQ